MVSYLIPKPAMLWSKMTNNECLQNKSKTVKGNLFCFQIVSIDFWQFWNYFHCFFHALHIFLYFLTFPHSIVNGNDTWLHGVFHSLQMTSEADSEKTHNWFKVCTKMQIRIPNDINGKKFSIFGKVKWQGVHNFRLAFMCQSMHLKWLFWQINWMKFLATLEDDMQEHFHTNWWLLENISIGKLLKWKWLETVGFNLIVSPEWFCAVWLTLQRCLTKWCCQSLVQALSHSWTKRM